MKAGSKHTISRPFGWPIELRISSTFYFVIKNKTHLFYLGFEKNDVLLVLKVLGAHVPGSQLPPREPDVVEPVEVLNQLVLGSCLVVEGGETMNELLLIGLDQRRRRPVYQMGVKELKVPWSIDRRKHVNLEQILTMF